MRRSRAAAELMMNDRPNPTDFAISKADVEHVEQQDARARRLKGKVDLAGTLIGGSSFVWAGFLVGRCLSWVGGGRRSSCTLLLFSGRSVPLVSLACDCPCG